MVVSEILSYLNNLKRCFPPKGTENFDKKKNQTEKKPNTPCNYGESVLKNKRESTSKHQFRLLATY